MSQKDGDQKIQMETWQQSVLGGWSTNQQMVWSMEEVVTLFPVKICILNHVNTTSLVSESCWPLLNSEKQ